MRRLAVRAKRRRNFFPALILALVFWGLWGWFVYSFPPTNNLILLTFYFLLFLAIFLTSALIFANSRLGILTALWFIFLLIFRYSKIGNALNIALLTGIFFLFGIYLKSK